MHVLNFVENSALCRYSDGQIDVVLEPITVCIHLLSGVGKSIYDSCETINCRGDKCRENITDLGVVHCESCFGGKENYICDYVVRMIKLEKIDDKENTYHVFKWKDSERFPYDSQDVDNEDKWEKTELEVRLKEKKMIEHCIFTE